MNIPFLGFGAYAVIGNPFDTTLHSQPTVQLTGMQCDGMGWVVPISTSCPIPSRTVPSCPVLSCPIFVHDPVSMGKLSADVRPAQTGDSGKSKIGHEGNYGPFIRFGSKIGVRMYPSVRNAM